MKVQRPPIDAMASDTNLRRRRRVLLVDDDESVRLTFPLALARLGVDVLVASSLSEAERILDERTIDLLITDLELVPGAGECGGLDLLANVRWGRPEIPVVLLTAHPNDSARIEAFLLGARDFLTKAASIPAIVERIAQIVHEEGRNADSDR